jgi:hypothetical protein
MLMGLRGPQPKPPEQRRRRNAAPAANELPADGFQGEHPALPTSWRQEYVVWERDPDTREKHPLTKVRRLKFLPATREWYETFARSPMATQFIDTDWVRLREIAPLKDRYNRGDHSVARELRQQESLLGATVKDRRAMQMTVSTAPAAAGGEQPAADVRALRAV